MKKIKVVDEEILNSAFFDEELTFWKSGVGVFMLNKEDRQQQSVDVHLFLLVKKFWRVASKKEIFDDLFSFQYFVALFLFL
jgi:hypothetical protein